MFSGHYHGNGKSLINLYPNEENNDISALRVMTIVGLAAWRVWSPEIRNDLLVPFQDTPENREVFLRKLKPQVSSIAYKDIEKDVGTIFKTCHKAISKIFAPIPGKEKFGVLNLTSEEVSFLNYINGAVVSDAIPLTFAERVISGACSLIPFVQRHKKPNTDDKYPMPPVEVQPSIEVEMLEKIHSKAFGQHPELKEIRGSFLLGRWMRHAEERLRRDESLLGG